MDQLLKYTVKRREDTFSDAIDGVLVTVDRNKVLELIQVSPENQSHVNLVKLPRNHNKNQQKSQNLRMFS